MSQYDVGVSDQGTRIELFIPNDFKIYLDDHHSIGFKHSRQDLANQVPPCMKTPKTRTNRENSANPCGIRVNSRTGPFLLSGSPEGSGSGRIRSEATARQCRAGREEQCDDRKAPAENEVKADNVPWGTGAQHRGGRQGDDPATL